MVVLTGFRAAPGLMTLNLLLSVLIALCIGGAPYATKRFVDSVVSGSHHELLVATVLMTVCAAGVYGPTSIAGTTGAKLTQRVILYLNTRVGELAGSTPGIEHFERPDYLRELDLLRQSGQLLGQGPTASITLLQAAIRIGLNVVLLWSVSPVVALLGVFAVVPFVTTRWAVRLRHQLDDELVEDSRLTQRLFALASTAGPAKESRIYGLSDTIRQRHAALAEHISTRTIRTNLTGALLTTGGWFVYAATFVAAVVFAVVRAVHGDATPGAVILVMQVGRGATISVNMIAQALAQLLSI